MIRASGEIGIHAGFRIQWRKPWGFESPLAHHVLPTAMALACFNEVSQTPEKTSKRSNPLAADATRFPPSEKSEFVPSIPRIHTKTTQQAQQQHKKAEDDIGCPVYSQ